MIKPLFCLQLIPSVKLKYISEKTASAAHLAKALSVSEKGTDYIAVARL